MMENTSPEKAETDELHHAMDRAKNAPSSENFHHLIKKLQEKLEDHGDISSGGGGSEDHNHHSHLFGVPSLHDQNEVVHGPRLPSLNSTGHFDAENPNLAGANSRDGYTELAESGEKSLNPNRSIPTDTILLVGSLIVMIFIGLIFHRIISYLAKLRSRRRQYQMGLKQLGEHMHVVTRTMSNPPSATATPVGTPQISMRKLAHLNSVNNNNNNIGSPNTAKKPQNLIAVAALKASAAQAAASGSNPGSTSNNSNNGGGGIGVASVHKASHSSRDQSSHDHHRHHHRGPPTAPGNCDSGNLVIPEDDNSVFKPSTHVMRREDSALGTLATAAQLRHKEHLHVHHLAKDED